MANVAPHHHASRTREKN